MVHWKLNIIRNLVLVSITLLVISSCTKKLEIDVVESRCKNFRISNGFYRFVDSDCGPDPEFKSLEITFDYNGDRECLHDIEAEAFFYNINGSLISGVRAVVTDSLESDGPYVTLNGNKATFHYCYQFTNINDTADLSYIQVNFHTENELDAESNEISVRANLGSVNMPDNFDDEINVFRDNITFRIWDDAQEDGDIISINFNGTWIIENRLITNAGEFIDLQLQPGTNWILFYAVNQGSSGPNTLKTSYDDGFSVVPPTFDFSMLQGETRAVKIINN